MKRMFVITPHRQDFDRVVMDSALGRINFVWVHDYKKILGIGRNQNIIYSYEWWKIPGIEDVLINYGYLEKRD